MHTKINESDLARRFQSLIAQHADLCKSSPNPQTAFDSLLPTFLAERQRWAESQRKSADDFNLFAVMGVQGDEVMHSKILAWLLDHRIERGTHAQGSLGFYLFLQEFKTDLEQSSGLEVTRYAENPNYWVRCEVAGNESRVDIEIAARDTFLIHIENKIHSAEGPDQTEREWRDLQAQRKALGVPENACHAIFLTLDGCEASNRKFCSAGWNRIAKVFDQFAAIAQPPEVKLFASHYAKAIQHMSAVEREEGETDDDEIQPT